MTLTDLRNAQNRMSTLIASMPASDALTLAAAHAEQARAAAPSYAGQQRAAAAAAEVRIAARRYSTGGDWRSAVRASLEHAQFAHALTPSYLQDAAPAALPVCRRQLAAAGDPEEREREQLAKDLARWAGEAAEREHDEAIEARWANGARHYTHCCMEAREDGGARNEWAFCMEMPLDKLRRRHASELAARGGLL